MQISSTVTPDSSIRQWIVFAPDTDSLETWNPEFAKVVSNAVSYGYFKNEPDEIIPLIVGNALVIVVGCGDKPLSYRARAVSVRRALLRVEVNLKAPIVILPGSDDPDAIRATVDGAVLGLYTWDKYKTRDEDAPNWREASISIVTSHEDIVSRQAAIADAINQSRDLGNENADVADALFIESRVRNAVENDDRCSLEVFGEEELRDHGFHLHLAVNKGSGRPPRLLLVSYQGGEPDAKPVALVGKGITYDTGGLNLKRANMDEMRMDMCGAAAVFGTLLATVRLQPAVNVLFVFALAENAIGPASYKPGDIVNSYSGITVEIANTDAEGRLVMADANSFVADTRNPAAIINVATLTGAVLIALGLEYTGLMSTHDELADSLYDAAQTTDDRAWRLPIYPELQEHIKSDFADCKNTGLPKLAGTISAGEFLRRFAQYNDETLPWAHLDIAGTGMLDREVGYFEPGATGAGVRLLVNYLMRKAS